MNRGGRRIAVIGGGITGLAAANRLAGSGHEIHLLEGADRLGGKLFTEAADGFLIEGGADSFVASRPRILELCTELGLAKQLEAPAPGRGAFISRRNQLYPIPQGLTGLVPTRFGPILTSRLLSPVGKLRLLAELRVPVNRAPDDESLKAFAVRRFGKQAYERLLEPLMAGISSSDGDRMSLAASFPHWRTAELEYGSVMRGITASRAKTPAPGTGGARPSGFLALRGGMSALVTALEQRLITNGVRITRDAAVQSLTRSGHTYMLRFDHSEPQWFDAVIIAVSAWQAAALLVDIAPSAAQALEQIPQRSSALVSLAYRDPTVAPRLHGTGYLVPSSEHRVAGGATFSSAKWPGRAPEHAALARVYIGRGAGASLVTRNDATLIIAARDELRETVGITATPEITRVHRWIDTMPQYTLGHLDRVALIEQTVTMLPGLALAGNMLRGVGVPVCIQSGEAAATVILNGLKSD